MIDNQIAMSQILLIVVIAVAAVIIVMATLPSASGTVGKETVCVGNCPAPGPMDCTIYGRKKDGSWPSGYECSSTP